MLNLQKYLKQLNQNIVFKVLTVVVSSISIVISAITLTVFGYNYVVISGLPNPVGLGNYFTPDSTPNRSLDFTVVMVNTDGISNTENDTSNSSVTAGTGEYASLSLTEEDKAYLARCLWHEARGEEPHDVWDGDPEHSPRINVCCVILNRLLSDSGTFKNQQTVLQVITAPNQFTGASGYIYNVNDVNDECIATVDWVLEHGDITNGALYFMTPKAASASRQAWVWKMEYLFSDGAHYFWK